MPHPERASDPMLGNTDGMELFKGLAGVGASTILATSIA
jgi:phosphoribosylformylglycinamidine synthase